MAFHQPTRLALQRTIQTANMPRDDATRLSPTAQSQQTPDELQTWVLFSPPDNEVLSSCLSGDSLQTPGRSRTSDFGSLDTNARSGSFAQVETHPLAPLQVASPTEDELAEDDAELDSLDSHLPDFRSIPNVYGDGTAPNLFSMPVLPTHDGLGSFRVEQPGNGASIQEQLYAFEQFNPRRRGQDRTSTQLHEGQLAHEEVYQTEKMQRIEAWRFEQSQILLEEVRKETSRRRLSQVSTVQSQAAGVLHDVESTAETAGISRNEVDHTAWHEDAPETTEAVDSRGFLSRVTRTVIKEFMGIDDNILSILFGESLPEQDEELSARPGTPRANHAVMVQSDLSWQIRLLERVARELGMLVNRLSHHPGAFSAFNRVQQIPIPYAGLPVIPEAAAPATITIPPNTAHSEDEGMSPTIPEFEPTVMHQASAIEISTSREANAPTQDEDHMTTPTTANGFSQDEWERELDIKLVFKYLRSRFSSRFSSTPSSSAPSHHLASSGSPQDMAAKAARVRQHHPLLSSRPRTAERRSFKAMSPSSPVALRRAPSCASQSTRRSARRSSCSSRHYWDIGGSLGTGSVIASNGPMGSWGDI